MAFQTTATATMAQTRDKIRSKRFTISPKRASPPLLSRSPGLARRPQNALSGSTRYFQKIESGAGVFAPVPGRSARESSISLVRKRRLPELEEKETYSKRTRYESGSDASTLFDVGSEEENNERDMPRLPQRPATPGIIRPRFERGSRPQNMLGSVAQNRIRPSTQRDNVFVGPGSDLSELEHYQQADQTWDHDHTVNEDVQCDSSDRHVDLGSINLTDADRTQLNHQQTESKYPTSTRELPLRQTLSPLSDDGVGLDIPGYPDFRLWRSHRNNPLPQLRRTGDQNLRSLASQSVEVDDLYGADIVKSASADPQSYYSVPGPHLQLSNCHEAPEDIEKFQKYRSRHVLNHISNGQQDRKVQVQIQDIGINHNLNNQKIERIRRDPNEELGQSSDVDSESSYVAYLPAVHRARRDEDYGEGSAAARRSARGQSYFEEQTVERQNTADAIILALRLQIERQEAELVRFRHGPAEDGAYTGRQVGHILGVEEGRQEQWEENQEVVDEHGDGSDAAYGQGFAAGQAEARRERGLAIQAAYRAGYMDRGEEMLDFVHRSSGREPGDYSEGQDDWP